MSSRVIRADIWASEPVNALHDRTFRLYIALINSADDYGLVSINWADIRRAAPLQNWSREETQKMLGELTDSGLILPYSVDQKQYAAIQKWRGNINSIGSKHPQPTFGMGHCGMPIYIKDAKTRKAAANILKHLAIESEPLDNPQRVASPPLVREEVRGKRLKIKPMAKTPSGFDQFWSLYPRRVKKPAAIRAWSKLTPNDQSAVIAALPQFPFSLEPNFQPHASTWLNERRWEDEQAPALALPGMRGVDF